MSVAVFEVFFDGECPLCRREIDVLQRLDKRERVRFTDIAAAGFEPESLGLTHAQLMARIHGRTADGELVEGVEVFRRLYAAVGFERMVALTRLPGVRSVLDAAYTLFAQNRLRLTGRCADGLCSTESPRPNETA
jgi:predicted DCC family thiol-disulfide oxidoreductase YuxK